MAARLQAVLSVTSGVMTSCSGQEVIPSKYKQHGAEQIFRSEWTSFEWHRHLEDLLSGNVSLDVKLFILIGWIRYIELHAWIFTA